MRNVEFFSKYNNVYEVRKNQQIANLYADRYVSSYIIWKDMAVTGVG